jgi:alanyl-tRNA synthetase
VTNHIEKKKSKCDYKFNRPLEEKEVRMLEGAVNDVIALNLDVKESFVSRKEAGEKYNVSKLPENVGDKIRIIAVGDYDYCPCIGQHVSNTSEIGGITIISTDFNEQTGILRIRYKIA